MSKEAMKLALEALEKISMGGDPGWADDVLPFLREALAEQPAYRAVKTYHEGKPVYIAEQPASTLEELYALSKEVSAEQPAQQEPVLQDIEQYRLQMAGISTAAIGYWKESDGIHPDYDTIALRDVAKLYAKYDELYRAQRKWVGLTDEEIKKLAAPLFMTHYWKLCNEFARATEAKLKEKNT